MREKTVGGIERGETGKKKSEVEVRKGRERERENGQREAATTERGGMADERRWRRWCHLIIIPSPSWPCPLSVHPSFSPPTDSLSVSLSLWMSRRHPALTGDCLHPQCVRTVWRVHWGSEVRLMNEKHKINSCWVWMSRQWRTTLFWSALAFRESLPQCRWARPMILRFTTSTLVTVYYCILQFLTSKYIFVYSPSLLQQLLQFNNCWLDATSLSVSWSEAWSATFRMTFWIPLTFPSLLESDPTRPTPSASLACERLCGVVSNTMWHPGVTK